MKNSATIPTGLLVEWSKSKDEFLVETFQEMLVRNWNVYYHRTRVGSDWVILGFADNRQKADEYIQQMKSDLDNPLLGSSVDS